MGKLITLLLLASPLLAQAPVTYPPECVPMVKYLANQMAANNTAHLAAEQNAMDMGMIYGALGMLGIFGLGAGIRKFSSAFVQALRSPRQTS
jgi:hypothetical protein